MEWSSRPHRTPPPRSLLRAPENRIKTQKKTCGKIRKITKIWKFGFPNLPNSQKKPSSKIVEDTEAILTHEFNYELEKEAQHILFTVCYEAEKYLGNEYDAALKFILLRLESLSKISSSKKTEFIIQHLKTIYRLQERCIISKGHVEHLGQKIAKSHNIKI